MEKNSLSKEMVESEKEMEEEEEEEFVLLDLDSIAAHIRLPENAPYVLSGLDTLNPILVIDDKIKLIAFVASVITLVIYHVLSQIGEYKETIGTCLVLNESDADSVVCEQAAGPSTAKKTPAKQINPMAQVNRVLKFRLYMETGSEDGDNKQADDVGNK